MRKETFPGFGPGSRKLAGALAEDDARFLEGFADGCERQTFRA
jgi:hypothetical protein